jgi:hypothetical protein
MRVPNMPVLSGGRAGPPGARVLPCRRRPDAGRKAWAIVEERGYEGMVAKDPQSRYYAGPTRSWVKVKQRHEGVFYVGGIRNVDALDGALVGEMVGDDLHYRGIVEWGSRAADMLELLREAANAPADVSVRGPADDAGRGMAGAAVTRRGQLRRDRRRSVEGAELAPSHYSMI